MRSGDETVNGAADGAAVSIHTLSVCASDLLACSGGSTITRVIFENVRISDAISKHAKTRKTAILIGTISHIL
jgi:hypothetical protein